MHKSDQFFTKIATITRDQFAIACGLASDWSITWREFFKPIMSKQRKNSGSPDKFRH